MYNKSNEKRNKKIPKKRAEREKEMKVEVVLKNGETVIGILSYIDVKAGTVTVSLKEVLNLDTEETYYSLFGKVESMKVID